MNSRLYWTLSPDDVADDDARFFERERDRREDDEECDDRAEVQS